VTFKSLPLVATFSSKQCKLTMTAATIVIHV